MKGARAEIMKRLGGDAFNSIERDKPPVVPSYVKQPQDELVQIFMDHARSALCSVEVIPALSKVPAAVEAFVDDYGLSQNVVVSEPLAVLRWHKTGLTPGPLKTSKDGIVAVTDCYAGVAETGTLVTLTSGRRDARLNFASSTHIVVLRANDIVGPYEAVWTRMEQEKIHIPRSVNFITGPSRTADIEQTIEIGAHGPRQVHIMLISSTLPPG